MGNESINWDKLGFDYIKTDKRYLSYFRDGEWDKGTLTEDNVLHISEGSTALHYGQQCFEGMKAYRCKDGSINLFRPDQNALRMQRSCARLLMPTVDTEQFIEACKASGSRQRALHPAIRHRRRAVPASVRDRRG